jgi:phage shock protein C
MQRRFYRSATDKYIGGVCGGLAEYFDIDPALVRILFVVMLFATGIGFLAYVVLWIATRTRPVDEPIQPPVTYNRGWRRYLPGLILIGLGLIFLARANWWWFDLHWYAHRFWPLVLIGLGLLLVVRHSDRSHKANPNDLPPAPAQHHNGEAAV